MVPQSKWCRHRITSPAYCPWSRRTTWCQTAAATTSLAARRKSIAIQNHITDLQDVIEFDAMVPTLVNYYCETTNGIFSSFFVRSWSENWVCYRRAFRVAVPQIWNDLIVKLQSSQSVHVFLKSRLDRINIPRWVSNWVLFICYVGDFEINLTAATDVHSAVTAYSDGSQNRVPIEYRVRLLVIRCRCLPVGIDWKLI